ncbi:MAG: metallophosphoesterase [Myxococcales bacterium]|jgi:3',5'-cyclic AMP phosphodiesterase CpdA|nr:metallophosphoesterase [Myxococcales bacterium]
MRLIHFSDVHVRELFSLRELPRFGWRRALALLELSLAGRGRQFGDSLTTLRRLVATMETFAPDHILFSGDFTALATPHEFEWAKEVLGPWASDPRRLSVVPGNHDRYTRRSVRERRFERCFGALLESDLPRLQGSAGFPFVRLVGERLAVIGLDTTRLAPFPGLAFGRIDPGQRRLLEDILESEAVRNRAVALLLHHAPLSPHGRPDTLTHGLVDAPELLARLAGRPRTSMHFGHIHHRYWLAANETRPHLFDAGAGTMRCAPGFWVIDLDDAGNVADARDVVLSRA